MTFSPESRETMFAEIEEGYQAFLQFINELTESQWTLPTDAAGWTVKDHVIHCAVWAGSVVAVINKKPRWEEIDVSFEVWKTIDRNYDQINEVIRQNQLEKSPAEVKHAFIEAHQTLIETARGLSMAELELPYSHYQTYAESETHPLYKTIKGNSASHYAEHLEYIRKILKSSPG